MMTEEGQKPTQQTPTSLPSKKKKFLRIFIWTVIAFLLLIVFLLAGYLYQNMTYYESGLQRVYEAGFKEKRVTVKGYQTNYVEGPDNGVPLLLIHGQGSLWQDYMKVLPELSKKYHVFAVDVYGHGQSDRLPASEYTNVRVGTLIAEFMKQVIQEPAVVSGHSSGGLITTWIAAHRPELVKGVILEDPPYFSSIMPRAKKTTGGDLAQVTHDFVSQKHQEPFQKYYVQHSNYFGIFGGLKNRLTAYSMQYLHEHPGQPLKLFFLPPTVNIYFQGIARYDPMFGAVWYDNAWYKGFNTAASLAAIKVPAVLIHTNYWYNHFGSYYDDRGVLMAAMDDKDLDKVKSLLKGVKVVQVDSGHLVHFEKADTYTKMLLDFASQVKQRPSE